MQPTLANVSQVLELDRVQHDQNLGCDPEIQHGCTLEFFDQFITIKIITMQSIDRVQGASKGNPKTFVKLSYLRQ
jgi:hypothetical protein